MTTNPQYNTSLSQSGTFLRVAIFYYLGNADQCEGAGDKR